MNRYYLLIHFNYLNLHFNLNQNFYNLFKQLNSIYLVFVKDLINFI